MLKVVAVVAVIAAALGVTPALSASAAAAASGPTWTGHWSAVITCSAAGCTQAPTALSFDLKQDGSVITGSATLAAGAAVVPLTGTASGLSATINGLTDSSTVHVTMSPDGTTLTGTVTVTDPTSGVTATFGTVTGTRSAGTTLSVSVSAKVPVVGLGIRRTAEVTVRVTAIGGAVKGVSLGDGLELSSDALEVKTTPPGLSGFSLNDGESRTFVFGVKGVKAGEVTVGAQATGTDPEGDEITGDAAITVKVGGPQLALRVSGSPASLSIRTGAVRAGTRTVTVKVDFANVGKEPVENIRLLSLAVVPVDHAQALKKLGFRPADYPLPFTMGTLAPGSSEHETFKLDATGGFGTYEVEALALFDDPSAEGGNGRAFATGAKFQVVTRTSAWLTLRFNHSETNIYIDPATGAILGKLSVYNEITHRYDVFVYDKSTGVIDLIDPETGQKQFGNYNAGDRKFTEVRAGELGAAVADRLLYDAKKKSLSVVVGATGDSLAVTIDQATGRIGRLP